MVNSVGPTSEQLTPAQRTEPETFQRAVGPLTDGALVFPAPFDLVTAAVLAGNDIDGEDAVDVADAIREGTGVRYHVQITQVVEDQPAMRREVVDAVVDPDRLCPLLRDVIHNVAPPN